MPRRELTDDERDAMGEFQAGPGPAMGGALLFNDTYHGPRWKRCPACGETKAEDRFHLAGKQGRGGYCKACHAMKARASRATWSLEKRRAVQAQRTANRRAQKERLGPLWHRRESLRRLHGMSYAQYEALSAAQGGACAICGGQQLARGQTTLTVDHDHATGATRGLLCNRCNMGLGSFSDDVAVLRAAIVYLERHQQGEGG